MDAVSGSVWLILMVAFSTLLYYVAYKLVLWIASKYVLATEPDSLKGILAVLLLLPMLILVWDFTFTGTVFTALPPYLTGLLVLVSVLKSNLRPRIKGILTGLYLVIGFVFIGQAIT
ncbi:hypothetical protein [Leeuwenhoekiella nanhaiensis]|uniref:Uncharacterized protein n=1 Tax=Leeuwenhoekiella nanhaiensis TaxID=1655491 RepID=A0A2G1VNK6_9FLAO|nr:hypothetical protein [Leeuwenhoekiella nanhaiensis]PHQ28324.1 hypothetical protein CJ305_15365 [Leeuwenhoekiella nanhaiensis]